MIGMMSVLTSEMKALLCLNRSLKPDEIPVAASILDGTFVNLCREGNNVESTRNPLCHAEALVISRVCADRGTTILNDCTLIVTLEPCPMCSFLIRETRIGRVVIGARSTARVRDFYDYLRDPRLGDVPEVIAGILEEECTAQLSSWFDNHRRGKV